MTDSLKTVRTRAASTYKPHSANPVRTQATAKQVVNNDGGFVFDIGLLEQAKRFLILGSEANFYTSGQELTRENAKTIIGLASDERTALPLIDLIVEVSTGGRAAKQNPAIFALAIAASHGSDTSKAYALSKLSAVARTGTSLFLFATYVEQFRGWGRGLKRAVSEWYTSKPVDKVAFQAVKYQSREGWSHADLARLSHPARPEDAQFNALMKWILKGDLSEANSLPTIVQGFQLAKQLDPKNETAMANLVREYGLSWEMLPTEALNSVAVWEALLSANLPLGALIRQLPRLTRIGFFAPFSDNLTKVVNRLGDVEELKRARIHPINLLVSMRTYAAGRSERGSSTWTPVREITEALDTAFYLAFKTIEPANKNTMIGVDVSYSMSGKINGSVLSSAEVAGALALVTMATEPKTLVYGFQSSLTDLDISPKDRLTTAFKKVQKANFGSTNPGALIEKAIRDNIPVETFIVITDNEVNSGRHVYELLKQYRAKSGIKDAKMIVMGTTASKFSIADPSDKDSLDIAGFDTATPSIVADFSAGRI